MSQLSIKAAPGVIALGLASMFSQVSPASAQGSVTSLSLASHSRSTSPNIDPTIKANYHIDRSDQDAFTERLRTKIGDPARNPWKDSPVEISFMAPLGLPFARNEMVRNFTEQQISRLEIFIDGQKVPYVEKPEKGAVNFWTLDVEPLTGQDQVAIRIPSPGGTNTPTLDVALDGTLIYSTLKPGASENGYRFDLSSKMEAVALEMQEGGYTVDTQRLSQQLKDLGLAPSGPSRVSDVIGKFADFYLTQATYNKNQPNQTRDVNQFFGNATSRSGNCHTLNKPSLLGLRSLGITAFYPSGRFVGTSTGHGTNYVYDAQLGDSFVTNFSGISAGRHSGTMLDSINAARPRNLIYFELDSTYLHTFGIEGIAGEPEPQPVVKAMSNCGRIAVSQDGKLVSSHFPDSVPGSSSVKKLTASDGQFVVFNGEGVNFNATLIARRNSSSGVVGGTQNSSQGVSGGSQQTSQGGGSPFESLFTPSLKSIGVSTNR